MDDELKKTRVFISYANEDRLPFVQELYKELTDRGLKVWYDEREIHGGDYPRFQIDEGLKGSHFVILILSENYFKKYWTKSELEAIFSLEAEKKIKLIPILKDIQHNEVKNFSPLLAGRISIQSQLGVKNIVNEIIDNIFVKSFKNVQDLIVENPLLHLPPRAYYRFIGRYNELEQLMNVLHEPEHKMMVNLIGLGGIGKTALAQEIVERCLKEKIFKYTVWVSFKTVNFIGESISNNFSSINSFSELLNEIGRQCNLMDIVSLSLQQKQTKIKNFLTSSRTLVVLDNLDTVPNREEYIEFFSQILGQSKLLVTSRYFVKNEQIFNMKLSGFKEEEGIIFLRENSKERGIDAVCQADQSQLINIQKVTGGAPLAMKLVIGQISRQPMEIVLNVLKDAKHAGPDYEFYRFIYSHSWALLDMNARKALVDMSVFPPNIGGAIVDIVKVTQVEPTTFWIAMDQLVTLSLVERTGVIGQERYALHTLTQYFIRSDITKEWNKNG